MRWKLRENGVASEEIKLNYFWRVNQSSMFCFLILIPFKIHKNCSLTSRANQTAEWMCIFCCCFTCLLCHRSTYDCRAMPSYSDDSLAPIKRQTSSRHETTSLSSRRIFNIILIMLPFLIPSPLCWLLLCFTRLSLMVDYIINMMTSAQHDGV